MQTINITEKMNGEMYPIVLLDYLLFIEFFRKSLIVHREMIWIEFIPFCLKRMYISKQP
jgi:hypothetical protein